MIRKNLNKDNKIFGQNQETFITPTVTFDNVSLIMGSNKANGNFATKSILVAIKYTVLK